MTFAAAKPADETFSFAYNAAGIDHVRYEYDDDIVPHLPLSSGGFIDVLNHLPVIGKQFAVLDRFDYHPVGELLYIDKSGIITPDTSTLRSTRDLSLAMEIVVGRFSKIVADHAIGCGSGYMKAVATTGVCPPPGS